jgi:3-keto-disaccharide hydrolase
MRLLTLVAAALVITAILPSAAQQQGFLGRWNLTGTGEDSNRIYWLEVTEQNGQLSGKFLNRGGSPVPPAKIALEGKELVWQLAPGNDKQPGAIFRATLEGGKLVGTTKAGERTVNFTGARPPTWPKSDANAKHTYGKPVELFDGKTFDAFDTQSSNYPVKWAVEDGVLTNAPPTRNLVSKQKFKDFRLQAEYKLTEKSNSGIYLRGRYEMQVLDDYGQPPEEHGHMAIYAWKAPLVNASKPAGEWQTVDIVIVGNRVTATLNGQKVHDNSEIQAITGGALDADETAPGPIMIQGDHTKVWLRKMTVTPIVN